MFDVHLWLIMKDCVIEVNTYEHLGVYLDTHMHMPHIPWMDFLLDGSVSTTDYCVCRSDHVKGATKSSAQKAQSTSFSKRKLDEILLMSQ